MKIAAIYVRVSSSKKVQDLYLQNPQVQIEPLLKLVNSLEGFDATEIYEDRMTGSDANRPNYQRLREDARRRKFKVVIVWRLDRLARSVKELIDTLDEFRQLGIEFISHKEAIDTSTATGKLMFHMVAAFAEFERELLRERTIAGLEYAKENGTKSGKAIGRPARIFDREKARRLRKQGLSLNQIAEQLKVGRGTVQRACEASRD
jgi:DNA invertase Pin-like site-specific DNA recombinase